MKKNRTGRCLGSGTGSDCVRLLCAVAAIAGTIGLVGCEDLLIPDPAVVYLAFGDSATAGAVTPAYPELLRQRLAEDPTAFTNQGRSGETSDEGLERLQALLAGGVFPNARVLLYWQGGNDITDFVRDHDPVLLWSPDAADYPFTDALTQTLDSLQANIESAIAVGRQAGMTVYVATYFALPETLIACDALFLDLMLPQQARHANVYVTMLNARVVQAVANQNASLVDIAARNAELQADRANYFDCNHLSEQGNDIAAEAFAEVTVRASR